VHTPLNASATTAGALLSGSTFEVPPYQREYSWVEDEEVSEFWNDLRNALIEDSYFLGLVILTEEGKRKHVVDGQQRILTLTLLAAALYHEALDGGRKALAERIQADFLRSIDYQTDETLPRVVLSDQADNETLQAILNTGRGDVALDVEEGSLSQRMQEAFKFLQNKLHEDLAQDPFKRLGVWTDFITNRLYFAVFIHPDSAAAYRVFEVINTRGRELTTADLLKNYVLSQTSSGLKEDRYKEWRSIARRFSLNGTNTFVQYIRHVVTVEGGHILPKDLFDFLARRTTHGNKRPPSVDELMALLKENLPLYMQMIDPTLDGPAELDVLKIFAALNSLGVIAVRPILLAISETQDSLEGMRYVLKLVVRRIVVGNLGTGNVERRFGEAAKNVHDTGDWHVVEEELRDLNPSREEFVGQIRKRSFNKGALAFLRRSMVAKNITPDTQGVLHFIMPRQGTGWAGLSEEDALFWGGTIANTFLATLERRPKDAITWEGFKHSILPEGVEGEWIERLKGLDVWDAAAMEAISNELAEVAGNVWY
jgi:hypothetical protein